MIKEITKEILSDNRTSLNQIEAREIFDEIYQGISSEISATAFIVACEKLDKTPQILQAIIEASKDAIKSHSHSLSNTFQTINLYENEKYLDIYFAVDIINSANNIKTIKYSNEKSNNNYIFKKFSTKTDENSVDFIENIEKTNFCYYYLDKNEKYSKYTNDIRKNIDFKNIFDFVDYFLNPFNIKNHIIGTIFEEEVQKLAELALLLKYENTIIVSSKHNVPYVVLDGENIISEAWKNKIFTYTLTSDLVDLPEFKIDDIKVENSEESLEIIENVFENKIKAAPYYTIVLNSALALYISKNTSSLMDGIKLAQKTIDSGLAKEKLNQIKIL